MITSRVKLKASPLCHFYSSFRSHQFRFKSTLSQQLQLNNDPIINLLDRSASDFLTSASGEVHVLRGFSAYRPSPLVIEAVRAKVNQSEQHDGFHAPNHSFFVIDLARVREKHSVWQKHLPGVKPHYAVKANPNPAILRLMTQELKINFDCASQSEIDAVLSLGVAPNRIIFANPCKSLSHIDYARRQGVVRTTFDSESELYKIKMVATNFPWELILRIWVDDKDAQCQLSNKYGAHADENVRLLTLAKTLGLNVTGISFHVGSGAKTSSYREAIRSSYKVFQKGLELGHPMRVLDLGGGYPGTCVPKAGPSLEEIGRLIGPELRKNWKKQEIIAEPGRFYCAEAQTLATQIIGKRVRFDKGKGGSIREYYINDGLYQSFNCMLYDHSVLLEEGDQDEPSTEITKYNSVIFGQTCDGLDQISKKIILPDLRVGDWLAVPNMGAYTNGASSQFNGFPLNDSIVLDESIDEDRGKDIILMQANRERLHQWSK